MKTKLSCLPVSLYKDFFSGELTIEAWSQYGAAMGLDAIDINALFLKDKTEEDITGIKAKLRLPVLMVSAYSDFTNPSEEKRAEAIQTAAVDMRRAAAIGAAYIRLTAGQRHPGQKDDVMLGHARDGFAACAKVSQETGVKILLENHSKPGAWDYPDYVFNTERFLAMWEAVGDLPVWVNYDTANAFALKEWEKLLAAVAGKIATVHLNDLSAVSPLGFSLVGEGIVPLKTMMAAVYDTGFCGEVSIEEASFRGWEGIRRAVGFAKGLCG